MLSICHPEVTKFKNEAANWGCQHENNALAEYASGSVHKHYNFKVCMYMYLYPFSLSNYQVEHCGFFIDTENPFIGASPDSLVTCSCYGDGICEIKVCLDLFACF